jgi:Ras GTPase-activating protein 1
LSAIKPLCVPQMVRSPKVAKLREVRTLHLALSEAHRLPLKLVPNPYFVVTFNQVSK